LRSQETSGPSLQDKSPSVEVLTALSVEISENERRDLLVSLQVIK
jgi:hypothetical protein